MVVANTRYQYTVIHGRDRSPELPAETDCLVNVRFPGRDGLFRSLSRHNGPLGDRALPVWPARTATSNIGHNAPIELRSAAEAASPRSLTQELPRVGHTTCQRRSSNRIRTGEVNLGFLATHPAREVSIGRADTGQRRI